MDASVSIPGESDVEAPPQLDRLFHAALAKATLGISPASLALAWADWALHLAMSPGKQQALADKAVRKELRLLRSLFDPHGAPCIEPLEDDKRFRDPAWQQWPFKLVCQAFLLNQQWWQRATTGIGGVAPHHEHVVSFAARQLLDMLAPVNFIATNPQLLQATVRSGGANLARGAANWLEDSARSLAGKPPAGTEAYVPGHDVAITPGSVVFRNHLIELIQYTPQTPKVHAEPVLIVPAWIMKYYILDLSPLNSLVRFLVARGHTVFIISWRNPDATDSALGMDDYLQQGALAALDEVSARVQGKQVHGVGYCLGGTLLSIAAAALARNKDTRLGSLTLLAAQTDFREAGELMLFIDDSQLDYLDGLMWRQGFLDNRQMAGAFQLLRSNDLVWSSMVRQYLMGERTPMTDMAAWNADATRLPYRMHSAYLRQFFLRNDVYEGRYQVDGKAIALGDIRVPLFVVGTERDHISPWRSVYKVNAIVNGEVDFVLTSGGHNAGIVSDPDYAHAHYRMARHGAGQGQRDPDEWYLANAPHDGSWWLPWADWLAAHSSGMVAPRKPGAGLGPAPGTYVLQR
ncbi:MAG: alpha/beta fold hydrolase [Pseudomonadota bacterium]